MENILAEISSLTKPAKSHGRKYKETTNYQACLNFSNTLHELKNYSLPQDENERQTTKNKEKKLEHPPQKKPEKKPKEFAQKATKNNAITSKWLYDKCMKLKSNRQSSDNAVSMSLAILSACSSQNKNEMESNLFDIIGANELEFLTEIIQKCEQIQKHIKEDELIRLGNGKNSNGIMETSSSQSAATALTSNENYFDKFSNFDMKALQNEKSNFSKNENWRKDLKPEGTKHYYENRGLPTGTKHEYGEGYHSVTIPMTERDESQLHPRIMLEDIMSPKFRKAFDGAVSLNPMQSSVFNAAFHSQENLLICAPTGAGKTNVAMLTVMAHFRDKDIITDDDPNDPYAAYRHIGQQKDAGFQSGAGKKIIYIAPMKALAQEVVSKFSSKLKPLRIVVKELTGDMQLSRSEADAANIIVTTPEKWDVITRKGSDDGSLGQACGLLIIDEVHLLADERGAVIESVVARLHRQVETAQRQVRIVALSATLPNYVDVANFLRVDQYRGLFFFGPEYRPVPLQQKFIGINEKDRTRNEKKMNEMCYKIVIDSLRKGYQVMIFVHSRKGCGNTARALIEIARNKGQINIFSTQGKSDAYKKYERRATVLSRNKEVGEYFPNGFGIHHAGMLRDDRRLTEQMFFDGAIQVLCCTATLAWGVNLPAHTVIMKGTDIYDPQKGKNVDVSILDVMQIFGRAGRPQFDKFGEATLITNHEDSLNRYLNMLAMSVPIESNFIKQLPDHLNAEIVSGTVSNINEAVEWLKYTYLYIRMQRNNLAYGISYQQMMLDPDLNGRIYELIKDAGKLLDSRHMIRFDPNSGNMSVSGLGRVASHFYIQAESVEVFNEMLEQNKLGSTWSDAKLCQIICSAKEFENVKVRNDELAEMTKLKKYCPLQIIDPLEEFSGKCSVLFQAYVSNTRLTSFTLISDTNYIASNAGRICRALFEICIKLSNMANAAWKFLRFAKTVDQRFWWTDSPLRHFSDEIKNPNVFKQLETTLRRDDVFEDTLALLDLTAKEVGELCHWYKGGDRIQKYIRYLPQLELICHIHPITNRILRFHFTITPKFVWNSRWHGSSQGYWVWIEDTSHQTIYHHEFVLISKKKPNSDSEALDFDWIIPAFNQDQYFIRVVSDHFVGCDMLFPVTLSQTNRLPHSETFYTKLLDLTPLPLAAFQNPKYESLYKFNFFNPMQTQLFHVLYHTNKPVLCCAPTGSGKTMVAEIAFLRMKHEYSAKSKCVYIAPLKSLARERLKEWRKKFPFYQILEMTGDTKHDKNVLNRADVLVCTPEKWDLVTRGWRKKLGLNGKSKHGALSFDKEYIQDVRLLVLDEVHLLGEERGAVLEAIVSRTRYISNALQNKADKNKANAEKNDIIRIIGLSTALANPNDLADWIGIEVNSAVSPGSKIGLYNFRPSVRPVPMKVHFQGFSGRHYCPRMATMNKPCYAAIKQNSQGKPVIIFVASRRQTRLTAQALISSAAGDENPRMFVRNESEETDAILQVATSNVRDSALRHTLNFGVGLHHAGLSSSDRDTVEQLFLDGVIQVLVATATLAWGVNLPAFLVIVKGTEYFDGKTSRYVDYPVTDVLQMIGRAGRPKFDTEGIAVVMVEESKKNFYYKFLYDPFPVESCLLQTNGRLFDNINAEVAIGSINSFVEAISYLEWTYLARRIHKNPLYYGVPSGEMDDITEFLWKIIKDTMFGLENVGCIEVDRREAFGDDFGVKISSLGQAASNFYLHYRTPLQMRDGMRQVRIAALDQKESERSKHSEMNNERKIETGIIAHILYVLSFTHEFDELPVRHNEDLLNAELCAKLPWGASKKPAHSQRIDADTMGDPHTKCYLLLQAHIFRVKLPVSDYVIDMNGVIDQIPRLLAAMYYISSNDPMIVGDLDFNVSKLFDRIRHLLRIE